MKKLFISALLLFAFFTANTQNVENILAASKQDASIYAGKYMEPIYKGLISNFNSGWYHSGKTHKVFGFDITINATASFVPSKDKTFVFKNSDYTTLELQSGTSADVPTAMGPNSTTNIVVNNSDINGNVIPNQFLPSFKALDGNEDDIGNALPSPMIQFGLGLPTKTDIKLRFVPTVGSGDVKFNLIGVGIQHNLLQHFLKADKISVIDLSILGAFTSSKVVYSPKDSNIGVNQETTIKINAYTAQLVANANLKIINFYAGLGYVVGDASTEVKGTYSYEVSGIGIPTGTTTSVTDPISIDYKMDSSIKATLGMRLNLAWFKIFADYSVQEYNTVNAGIAFSFR